MKRLLACTLLAIACDASPQATPVERAPTANSQATAPSSSPSTATTVDYVLRQVGGVSDTDTAPMVIAIHGLGDAPERLVKLLDGIVSPARLVFPRGLTPHGNGYSWFSRGPHRTKEIQSAAAKLAEMITTLTERYPTRGKPAVTGFSQGGMLTYALAVGHGDKISIAIPLAGALPPALVPLRAPAGSPPIFGLHGDADTVLPITPTRDLTQLLRERGFTADLTEYPGVKHTVSPAMHRAMMRHLHTIVAPAEP